MYKSERLLIEADWIELVQRYAKFRYLIELTCLFLSSLFNFELHQTFFWKLNSINWKVLWYKYHCTSLISRFFNEQNKQGSICIKD